ncbi:hypothetical protein HDU76_009727, partial [Blyttiomyces sp. JEL0837]
NSNAATSAPSWSFNHVNQNANEEPNTCGMSGQPTVPQTLQATVKCTNLKEAMTGLKCSRFVGFCATRAVAPRPRGDCTFLMVSDKELGPAFPKLKTLTQTELQTLMNCHVISGIHFGSSLYHGATLSSQSDGEYLKVIKVGTKVSLLNKWGHVVDVESESAFDNGNVIVVSGVLFPFPGAPVVAGATEAKTQASPVAVKDTDPSSLPNTPGINPSPGPTLSFGASFGVNDSQVPEFGAQTAEATTSGGFSFTPFSGQAGKGPSQKPFSSTTSKPAPRTSNLARAQMNFDAPTGNKAANEAGSAAKTTPFSSVDLKSVAPAAEPISFTAPICSHNLKETSKIDVSAVKCDISALNSRLSEETHSRKAAEAEFVMLSGPNATLQNEVAYLERERVEIIATLRKSMKGRSELSFLPVLKKQTNVTPAGTSDSVGDLTTSFNIPTRYKFKK